MERPPSHWIFCRCSRLSLTIGQQIPLQCLFRPQSLANFCPTHHRSCSFSSGSLKTRDPVRNATASEIPGHSVQPEQPTVSRDGEKKLHTAGTHTEDTRSATSAHEKPLCSRRDIWLNLKVLTAEASFVALSSKDAFGGRARVWLRFAQEEQLSYCHQAEMAEAVGNGNAK